MPYDLYPAVDSAYNFPPLVRAALAASTELRNTVLALTTTQRNNLAGAELWDGRTIVNTTTDRINRYDLGTTTWVQVADSSEITALDTQHQLNLGLRNVIRNGDMKIAQRGVGPFTTYVYGLDGWANAVLGASTLSTTQTVLAIANAPQRNALAAAMGVAASGAGDVAKILCPIEDVRTLAGQQVTLSFTASSSVAGRSVGLSLNQRFGSGGSFSADAPISVGVQVLTTGLVRYSVTFNMPSISAKQIGTTENSSIEINFWLGSGATNLAISGLGAAATQAAFTLTLTDVQLELGPVATPFERLPQQMQLAWCQRYFAQMGDKVANEVLGTGLIIGAASGEVFINLPVVMRASPTMLISLLAHFTITDGTNGGTPTTLVINIPGPQVLTLTVAATALGVGKSLRFIRSGSPAGSFLAFSSEL